MAKPHQSTGSSIITKKVAAKTIVASYEFEPPLIPCTIRLRDVLEHVTDAELALQPSKVANEEHERR